jgi:malate/lactate dehydrogenase
MGRIELSASYMKLMELSNASFAFELDMIRYWHAHANVSQEIQINLSDSHTFSIWDHGEDTTPRIDDHRVAPGFPILGMFSTLPCGKDIALILNRSGSEDTLPVSFTGYPSKCGRHRN